MLLNDKQIKAKQKAWGMIKPFSNSKMEFPSWGLGTVGYDIRLGPIFRIPKARVVIEPGDVKGDDFNEKTQMIRTLADGELFCVEPQSAVWVQSMETFKMPNDLVGISQGKSTYNRCGLIVSQMVLEPGWHGRLEFSLMNVSEARIFVKVGGGIAQIMFHTIGEPDAPYDGSYQEDEVDETDSTDDSDGDHDSTTDDSGDES